MQRQLINFKIKLIKRYLLIIVATLSSLYTTAQIDTNCIRRKPEASVMTQNPNVRTQKFELRGKQGYEYLTMFLGDSILIEHTGCKEYKLIYTVRASRFDAEPNDAKYWFTQGSNLLFGLSRSDVPFDYEWTSYFLDSIANSGKAVLKKTYIFDQDNGTIQTIRISNSGKLVPTGGFYVMTLVYGPRPKSKSPIKKKSTKPAPKKAQIKKPAQKK